MKPLRTSVNALLETRPKRTPGQSNPHFRDWYDRLEGNFLDSEPSSVSEEYGRYSKQRTALFGNRVRPNGALNSEERTLYEIYPGNRAAARVIQQVASRFADKSSEEATTQYDSFLQNERIPVSALRSSVVNNRHSQEFRSLCSVLAEAILTTPNNFDPNKVGAPSWLWKHLFPIAYKHVRKLRSPVTGIPSATLSNPTCSSPASVGYGEEEADGECDPAPTEMKSDWSAHNPGRDVSYLCLSYSPFACAPMEK